MVGVFRIHWVAGTARSGNDNRDSRTPDVASAMVREVRRTFMASFTPNVDKFLVVLKDLIPKSG